ncbi:MAG: hypoxanthine phosphoribosyltransferase [Bacteroidia bacterium]|jgi:hypoxanthine phosphoribosyltransferase
METVKLHDRNFKTLIHAEQIAARVSELGKLISLEYDGMQPVLLCVLRGAFIFTADLNRTISIPMEMAFIQIQSYEGTSSSGKVTLTTELPEYLRNRHVLIVEDIVETGLSLEHLIQQLDRLNPLSVRIAALLVKPEAKRFPVDIHFTGFEISNEFVVGYGMDYDGLGRNLPHIYAEVTS